MKKSCPHLFPTQPVDPAEARGQDVGRDSVAVVSVDILSELLRKQTNKTQGRLFLGTSLS